MERRSMTGSIRQNAARTIAVVLMAIGVMAVTASGASAGSVYKNMPAKSVKDTESECLGGCGHTAFGGIVQFSKNQRHITSVYTEVSSFSCQKGVYYNDTCETDGKATFAFPVRIKVLEVSGNEPGALIGEAETTAQVHFKPTPNVLGCPNEGEGRGWGSECHIGILTEVKFSGLSIFAKEARVAILVEEPKDEDPYIVNVATSTPYNGVSKMYEPIPAPAKGSDPFSPEVLFASATHPDGETAASTEEAPGSQVALEVKADKA